MSHTPGPWKARGRLILADDDRETIVCEVTGSPDNPESQADARLIAAAPEMLALLKIIDIESCPPRCDCGTETKQYRDAVIRAREIIRRLEGVE